MNIFDLGVLIIVGLSALLSFYRGFVREVLSLGGWVVASIITLRFLDPATELLRPHIHSTPIAVAMAAIGLFIISLILFSILTGMAIKFLKLGEKVGLLDNLAGLCFGVARGSLVVAIAFFVMTKFFTNEEDYPDVVRTAVSRPYVEQCAQWLGSLAPEYLDKVMKKDKDADASDITEESGEDEKVGANPFERGVKILRPKKKEADEDLPASSLPSIEDLKKRIQEENEKNNVR